MTAKEIRRLVELLQPEVDQNELVNPQTTQAILLAEIAAQLADLNERQVKAAAERKDYDPY
jgi:hypothetical protein